MIFSLVHTWSLSIFLSYTCTFQHLYISNQFKHCHWNKYLIICAHLSKWSVNHLSWPMMTQQSLSNNILSNWNCHPWQIMKHFWMFGTKSELVIKLSARECWPTDQWWHNTVKQHFVELKLSSMTSLEGKPTKYFCAGIWSNNYPSNWHVIY